MTGYPLPLPLPVTAAIPEHDLVTRVRAGDRDAVEETYIAHHAAIRGFARRLVGDSATAEDLVHDTFLALPRAIRGFRGDASLRSLLIGVAVNHARRHIRAAMRRRRATERMAADVRPESIDGSEVLARKQLADKLSAALDRLPIDQRVVFVLCEAEQPLPFRDTSSTSR